MLELPLSDDPHVRDIGERGYTDLEIVDDVVFARWSEPGGTVDDDGRYGMVRVADEGREITSINEGVPITRLFRSYYGAALLAARRTHGDPCGGCRVTQRLVEADPATGEIAADYGMPAAYAKDWRVEHVD